MPEIRIKKEKVFFRQYVLFGIGAEPVDNFFYTGVPKVPVVNTRTFFIAVFDTVFGKETVKIPIGFDQKIFGAAAQIKARVKLALRSFFKGFCGIFISLFHVFYAAEYAVGPFLRKRRIVSRKVDRV